MKCKNEVLVVYWKNKKVQVLGIYGIASKFKGKINGYYTREICDGNIDFKIHQPYYLEDLGEIQTDFRCDRCGKKYFENIEVKDIVKLVENHMEDLL